jgi:hypothetical protein
MKLLSWQILLAAFCSYVESVPVCSSWLNFLSFFRYEICGNRLMSFAQYCLQTEKLWNPFYTEL